MLKSKFVEQERKGLFQAVTVTVLLFVICLSFGFMLFNAVRQREILETTDRYMAFESKVERLIYANVTLLRGFEAYVKSNANLDKASVYRYLDELLQENTEFIRNVAILRDTTILWNYPVSSNAVAIGVDLAEIDGQRESVLKVKEELAPIFHGPFNLVQGGSGFSVRMPIIRNGYGYWGQTSIVLKTERLLEEIRTYAESAGLDISIFSHENPDVPFFETEGADRKSVLVFNVDPSFINWIIYVKIPDSLSGNLKWLITLLAFSACVSASIGFFAYKYLKSNHRILNMSTHDFLTKLYNRHFLDEYQAIALSAARREKRRAAIVMIDLNHFKSINDTYGHGVGDKVLIETGRLLGRVTRANEAVFRLGGDEFLIMLPKVNDLDDVLSFKSRILQRFQQEFQVPGCAIKADLAIGYAIFPEDGEDIDALLRTADKRLYREKEMR
jgi:diguanylate cyclase (GGDEF)-like protein